MGGIVFIDPRGWQGAVNGGMAFPNIGIAYLVSAFRKYGYEISVIDLNNMNLRDEDVLIILEKYQPDIVGFSVKTATINSALSLAEQIKVLLPKVNIIIGGPHATLAWSNLLKLPWFDTVFVGEGEEALPIICQRLISNEHVEGLPGVVTKRNFNPHLGNPQTSKPGMNRDLLKREGASALPAEQARPSGSTETFTLRQPFVSDLDSLAFPEYDLFPENVIDSISKVYPLLTSRGCIYKCSFCSVPEISGRNIRRRSPGNIIEELKLAKEKYKITKFEVIDDLFNFDLKHCKDICRAFVESGLEMIWSCPNGLRADRIDSELAQLMFKSGCRSVMVGVESADSIVLEAAKKGETIDDIEKGILILKKAGIDVGGYFIIGLPNDSFRKQEKSIEFVRRLNIDALFNMFVPYPGTELWEWAKSNARFLFDIEDGLHFADSAGKVKPVIETGDFSALERQKAYEMVHTKLRKFDRLVPNNLSKWQKFFKKVGIIWKYDRLHLPVYILDLLFRKLRHVFG